MSVYDNYRDDQRLIDMMFEQVDEIGVLRAKHAIDRVRLILQISKERETQ